MTDIYVTYDKALEMTNVTDLDHLFINLPDYLKPEDLKEPSPIESLYEILKTINNNNNIKDYLAYGYMNTELHKDIEDLINRLIYHTDVDYLDYVEPLKEEYKKLDNDLLKPSLNIKVRINAFALLIKKLLVKNPRYDVEQRFCLAQFLIYINNNLDNR